MLSGVKIGKRKRKDGKIEPKSVDSTDVLSAEDSTNISSSAENVTGVKHFTDDINQKAASELRGMLKSLKGSCGVSKPMRFEGKSVSMDDSSPKGE